MTLCLQSAPRQASSRLLVVSSAGGVGGGHLVSDSVPVFYLLGGLHHQHIVPNLGASGSSQSPIKLPDHSDKVTDLMLSDIIKLSI